MLKTIFPTIISVPRIHDTQLHHAIEYANQLALDLDTEEFHKLLSKYPESPDIRFVYLNELQMNAVDDEEATPVLEEISELIAKNPDNLRGKILGYYSKMEEDPNFDMTLHFEREFEKEIASLLHDVPYPIVIQDTTFSLLIKLLMVYCVETKNEAGIEKLFLVSRSMEWHDLLIDLSLLAVGEEALQVDMEDDEEEEIYYWYNELEKSNLWIEPNPVPHYNIFYKVLNRSIKDFTDEDVTAILTIEDRIKLSHDICWLLDQGCLRIMQLKGNCNCDFILQATYLIANYQLQELAPLVTRIMTGAPDRIFSQVSGDFSGEFLLPWIYSLGKMDLEGWSDMLTFKDLDDEDDSYWYIKTTWLNALVKISSESGPQSEQAKELVDKLWTEYQISNHECLGWLTYYIVSYKIDDYDDRIKDAFEINLIDRNVHGTFEDVMADKDQDIKFFVESSISKEIGDNYHEIIKYVRTLVTEYQDPTEENVANEMEYYRRQGANDGEDKDYGLSAKDLALIERLYSDDHNNDDRTYSPYTIPSIIPIKREEPKVGRNDSCPCGSGKKYKKCCL